MKFIVALVLALALIGCGNDKTINGKFYKTYGLINADNEKSPDIKYEPIWGNVIWGALLCETVIAPVYFYGFSLFEPVGPRISGQ